MPARAVHEPTDPGHNEAMSTDTSTSTASFAPVGWARRPDGGRMFTPGKRHLYDASLDLDEVAELRTLCVTLVPREVLRSLRGAGRKSQFAAVAILDERELAAADPCTRCAKKAEKAGAGA